MSNRPTKVITHTAVSLKKHTVEDVDQWHKVRWPGFTSDYYRNKNGELYHVGYHYVIEWDGTVVQTRGHNEEGAHCRGQNNSSIGICLMGNGDNHLPSEEQIKAYVNLFKSIQVEFPQITVYDQFPHRKYANKSCHGKLLADDFWIREVQKTLDYQDNRTEEYIRSERNSMAVLIELLRQYAGLLMVKLDKRRMHAFEQGNLDPLA